MDRAEVSSSNNGNAQRTIFGQNLLVNRNKVNTNTFDKLLTDLEAKVNLVNGEIKQINRQFSTLNVQQQTMYSMLATERQTVLDGMEKEINRTNINCPQNGKNMAMDVDKSQPSTSGVKKTYTTKQVFQLDEA